MAGYSGTRPAFADLLKIVDIRTKIVSVSSLLIGSGWALATAPDRFSWGLLGLMAAATLLIDMGTTGFNSYFDFVSGVDTRESDQERFKALVQRDIDPRIALHLSFVLFAVAVPLGLAIGARAGPGVVATGASCMLFAYFYSGGPRPISRTRAGEFFAGGLLGGVLIVVAAFVHTRSLDAATILVGVPSSFLIAGILSTNNACDRVGDARAGRRTLAIVLGPDRSHWPVFALVAAAYVAVALLAALGVLAPWAFLPMALSAALAWRTLAAMRHRGWSHATKAPNMGGISLVFVVFTACLLASFALGA
ncbi:MAG: prenyltransferase [Betaproteobacteria bacterium]|nr:prenyltransferase [Betaproteobacteria bacterium]